MSLISSKKKEYVQAHLLNDLLLTAWFILRDTTYSGSGGPASRLLLLLRLRNQDYALCQLLSRRAMSSECFPFHPVISSKEK